MNRSHYNGGTKFWYGVASVLLVAFGLQAQAPPATESDTSQTAPNPGLNRSETVGPEDTITILALNAEEISKSWRISASGELNLPMVGRIHAAGMTVDQLEREVSSRLRRFIRDPQVTLYVSEFRSHPVVVGGAVDKPGVLLLPGPTPLFNVLVQAGGPKDPGQSVTVTRTLDHGPIPDPAATISPDGSESVLKLPLQEVMSGQGRDARFVVQAYDVVTVSDNDKPQKMVYVIGEVTRQGSIELVHQNSVSVTRAIALAGGMTRTASAKKVAIRHTPPGGGEVTLSYVNVKDILAGKNRDPLLAEGDMLIIPAKHQLLGTYVQTALPSVLTATILVLAQL